MSLKENKIPNTPPFAINIYEVQEQVFDVNKGQGSNQKEITVVCSDIEENQRVFLQKILAAAKFDIDADILLFNKTNDDQLSFRQLRNTIPIKFLLLFGILPKEIGLHANCLAYEPFQFNGITVIFADDLKSIGADQKLKGALWSCIKETFDL